MNNKNNTQEQTQNRLKSIVAEAISYVEGKMHFLSLDDAATAANKLGVDLATYEKYDGKLVICEVPSEIVTRLENNTTIPFWQVGLSEDGTIKTKELRYLNNYHTKQQLAEAFRDHMSEVLNETDLESISNEFDKFVDLMTQAGMRVTYVPVKPTV
jgi:hypothetical protein